MAKRILFYFFLLFLWLIAFWELTPVIYRLQERIL